MPAGQFCGRRVHFARQFSVSNHRTGEGDSPDPDPQRSLNPQDINLDRGLFRQESRETF